jgi:AraC family transcriptional activator of pobA
MNLMTSMIKLSYPYVFSYDERKIITDTGMKSTIRQLTFNEDLSLGFEIIPIDSHYAQSKKNLRMPHRASFYCIIWFEKGWPVHTVDFSAVVVQPDSFLFIRKDAVQFFDQLAPFKARVLIFTDAFFCKNESDNQFLQSNPLFNDFGSQKSSGNIKSNALMKEVWMLMEKEAKQPTDVFQPGLLRNHLSSFVLLAGRERQQSGYEPVPQGTHLDLLIAFKNELERAFKTERGVRYYAQKLFVSDKVLTHAVQITMGKTPKQLIDDRVMLEAKRLLVHGNDSAKIVGISLGFDEPTNFNKFFKKHSGKTTSEFRGGYLSERSQGAKVSS